MVDRVSPEDAREIAEQYQEYKEHFLKDVIYQVNSVCEDLKDDQEYPKGVTEDVFDAVVDLVAAALVKRFEAELNGE